MLSHILRMSLAAVCFCSVSCIQMVMKDHGFRKTPAVTINGAEVNSALKPMGGKSGLAISAMAFSAGTGTLDGPFIWRIEAVGQEDVHEWIRLNAVTVSTEKTKMSESFPKSKLGVRSAFVPLPGEEGKSFAKFQIPGKLEVFPRKDGKVKIRFNVSVRADGRTKTEWVEVEMEPESKWKNESVFLPTEIIKSFGPKDPRRWDW